MSEENTTEMLLTRLITMVEGMEQRLDEVKNEMSIVKDEMAQMEARLTEKMTGEEKSSEDMSTIGNDTSVVTSGSYVESIGGEESGEEESSDESEEGEDIDSTSTPEPLFELAGLDPALLEKIITKLHPKSYFRLQMTCRWMFDFIQQDRNISVHLNHGLYLHKEEPRLGFFNREHNLKTMELHGIKACSLNIHEYSGPFEPLYNMIKESCFTCKELTIIDRVNWSKDDWALLLDILKCQSIVIYDHLHNLHEAIFLARHLKKVDLCCDAKNAEAIIRRALPSFSRVNISVEKERSPSKSYFPQLIFQILSSQPLPNLQGFTFWMTIGAPCIHEMEKFLGECGLEILGSWQGFYQKHVVVVKISNEFWIKLELHGDDSPALTMKIRRNCPELKSGCHHCRTDDGDSSDDDD